MKILGMTLPLGVADQLTLTLKEITTIQKPVTRVTERTTSSQKATRQKEQTKESTTKTITSRYGGTGAYGGMRK